MEPSQAIIEQIDPPITETRVTKYYGGAGLLFCRLGFHDKHFVNAEDAGRGSVVYVCLRCGRILSEVVTEWEEEE